MSLSLPSTDGSASPARKQVLVFRELPPDQLARLTAVHDVTVADPRKPDERARFDAALAQAHGLIGSSFPIDAAVLARAPRLQVVSSISVGVDNYALDVLQARGVKPRAFIGLARVGHRHVVHSLQPRQLIGRQLAKHQHLLARWACGVVC